MKKWYCFVLFLCAFLLFPGENTAQNVFTIGSGTSSNGTMDYPAPYGQYYTGARQVFIYRKQELIDSGWTTPRQISQLGFNVTSLNATNPYLGFTIKMKFSPISTLSAFPTGMTTVYTATSEMPVLGWNMKTLTVPMTWDTTMGNIIVEVCFSNGVSNYTENASTELTTGLPAGTSYGNWDDNSGNGCPDNSPGRLGAGSGSTSDRPNIRFLAQPNIPMVYDLSWVEGINDFSFAGRTDQKILKYTVSTTGIQTPLNVTSLTFSTAGSTDAAGDIARARIYYTGLNDQFSTANLFGQVVAPNGTHTVSSSQQLSAGPNYFWIVYDVKPTATEGNLLNADITSVTVGGTPEVPSVTTPAGAIRIGRMYDFDGPTAQGFLGLKEGGLVPNEWERGVPSSGPAAPVSAPNCWGTNLSGDFSQMADYSLVSPSMLVTDSVVNIRFQQWFDFADTYNDVYADLDFQVNNGGWSNLMSIDNYTYANSNDEWKQILSSIATTANDTIQFRWHFQSYNGATAAGWFIDDFIISGITDMPQYYYSGKVAQSAGAFDAAQPNIEIINVEINAPGTLNPLYITELEFNTNGSTAGVINNAKVYYTGNNENFSATNQFGSTVVSPSGTFTVTDSITLLSGKNYFWLVYNAGGAQMNDIIDAECTQMLISGVTHVPDNAAPVGYRIAGRVYNFDTTTSQGFAGIANSGTTLNEWERGTPSSGPQAAFNGTNCWATNLAGNYTMPVDYSLQTPVYIATESQVDIGYNNWFNLGQTYNDVNASLEYQVNSGGWSFVSGIDNYTVYKSLGWEEVRNSIPVTIGDSIQFRWSFSNFAYSQAAAGWYIDQVVIGGISEIPQVYSSSLAVQTDKATSADMQDLEIMQVEVNTIGTVSPLYATTFDFNTAGSVPGVIANAKLYYTGNVNKFSVADAVGSMVINPSGAFSFSDSVLLFAGTNYFWLTYSLNGTAQIMDSVDAEFTHITIDAISHIPDITAPEGKAVIGTLYNFDSTTDQGFKGEIMAGSGALTTFERGVPTNGPSVTYSGDKCWATMLDRDYERGANCALTTAPMLVASDNIIAGFEQWFDFARTSNNVNANFHYQINNGGWNQVYGINNTDYANSGDKWENVSVNISATPGDTIQFRWTFITGTRRTNTAPGWYIDNFIVSGAEGLDQTYLSATATQNETPTAKGKANQVVLQLAVEALGTKNALTADAFEFNTNGSSTTPSLISNAKLYYTGTVDKFSQANQYGSTITSPSGVFSVSGSQKLESGTNYFWLTYTIDAAAVTGDSVDAEFNMLTLSSGTHIPGVIAPAGNKKIGLLYDFEAADDQGFTTQSFSSVPSEWQRGVPSNSMNIPNTAYSGTKVWKTNLTGPYANNAYYALQSPTYIATSSTVELSFEEAMMFEACCDYATIEYEINNSGFNFLASYNNAIPDWQLREGLSVSLNPGDTIVFRWTLSSDGSGNFEGWMIDDLIFSNVEELQMNYVSADIQEDTSFTAAGFEHQTLLRINVITSGSQTPLAADYFKFNTTGTTDAGDITSAKVYYTGGSKSFVPTGLFGQVSAPNGSFTITGNQPLLAGHNFFWLVYDIAPSAAMGNLIDAEIDSVGINGTLNEPSAVAPLGARKITTGYNFEAAGTQQFTTVILSGTTQQWEKGAPTGAVPHAPLTAFGGSNCWATNLSGKYVLDAAYALVSPMFIANSADVEVAFKQFYATDDFICGSNANLYLESNINNGGWNVLYNTNGVTQNWEDFRVNIFNAPGDTIQLRWNLTTYDYCYPNAGWYIDDVIFSDVTEIDGAPPVITYTPLGNTATLTNRVLAGFAEIADFTGVDSTTYAPRIYYKKYQENDVFGANNNTVNGWKHASASNLSSPFSFTIDYSLLASPLAVGDTIVYFVVAQDVSAGALTSAMPAAGFTGTAVDAITAAPASPYQYVVTLSPMSGTYNVGSGQVYSTLSAATYDLNIRGVSGAVTLALTDNSYTASTETFPIVIGNVAGASASNTITIKPTIAGTTISGSSVDGIFRFNQAKYATLNGAITGSTKDLTIENTMPTQSPVVWFSSAGLAGCLYDSVMNCNIKAGSSNNNTLGVLVSGSTIAALGNGHDHLVIKNNTISKAYTAVYAEGSSLPGLSNISILDNMIGSGVASERIKYSGIELYRTSGGTIRGNTLYNFFDNSMGYGSAIYLGTGCTGFNIENNIIDSMVTNITSQAHTGIFIYTEEINSNILVANNFISRIYSKENIYGIFIAWGSGNVRVYNNTVNLSNTYAGAPYTTQSACLYLDGGNTNLDIRNNILSNSYQNASSLTSVSYTLLSFNTAGAFSFLDYNNYRVGGSQGILAYFNANKATLAALRSASGKDARSANEPVFFVSASDLHLAGSSIGNFALAGTPLAAVPLDIDGQTRSLIFPYKGADENASPLPVTLTGFMAARSGSTAVLNWTTASEINNRHFVIERSADMEYFEAIGEVKGKGNSNTVSAYSFVDKNAAQVANKGTLYYRLRQVDFNGSSALSDLKAVSFNEATVATLNVYPNPFVQSVSLSIESQQESVMNVSVLDLQGRVLIDDVMAVHAGANTISFNKVGSLAQGIYMIRTQINGMTYTQKLIKAE